jgi:hypothetical protein
LHSEASWYDDRLRNIELRPFRGHPSSYLKIRTALGANRRTIHERPRPRRPKAPNSSRAHDRIATGRDGLGLSFRWGRRGFHLLSHHVKDRLLPLKQTVRHPLDPPMSLHVHIAARPPDSGSRDRRYRGDRGGGGRTSLHRPPDKSSSRIGLTSLCSFEDGVRRQRHWSQAWRQREGRTCLQNRWAGESSRRVRFPSASATRLGL